MDVRRRVRFEEREKKGGERRRGEKELAGEKV